jgi:hypothetical protein
MPEGTGPVRFRTTIKLEGKTATGFQVPGEVVSGLGQGKRPPVRVTIGGHTYRSTVAAYGDVYMLPLSAENRAAAGVAAGDEIEVALELDTAPREVVVPPDFAAALAAEPAVERFFAGLSYSQRRWFVLGIEDAKTPETRQRRIEAAVARLREGRGQR